MNKPFASRIDRLCPGLRKLHPGYKHILKPNMFTVSVALMQRGEIEECFEPRPGLRKLHPGYTQHCHPCSVALMQRGEIEECFEPRPGLRKLHPGYT